MGNASTARKLPRVNSLFNTKVKSESENRFANILSNDDYGMNSESLNLNLYATVFAAMMTMNGRFLWLNFSVYSVHPSLLRIHPCLPHLNAYANYYGWPSKSPDYFIITIDCIFQ